MKYLHFGLETGNFQSFLDDLPDDLVQVVEDFKLVALRYKLGGWEDVSLKQMAQVLQYLSELVHAPSES